MAQLFADDAVRQVREALQMAAPPMAQLTRTGGIDDVAVFVLYLAATQERSA